MTAYGRLVEDLEHDRDDALDRARQLHDDHPDLDEAAILTALDDEFAGSAFYPSASDSFRREVARIVG